jgi:tetratricopeptide (TPR) repeat protein
MANPGQALTVPGGEALLQAAAEHRRFRGRKSLILDAAILAVLKNDAPGALERLNPLLEQPAEGGNAGTILRFGAELLYDFGNPERAAELFARSGDDRSIARQADSLVLAGRTNAARGLWTVLAAPDLPGASGGLPVTGDIRIRSLYNLAASAKDADEEAAALERLLALDREHLFGVIRYTRLLPAPRAAAILEDSALPEREALADLELLRRRRESWSIDRMVPETWLLINRHPETEALYQWAGYYFVLQRRYYEVPPLLRAAVRKGFTGSWLDLQRALEHIRQGRFDEAEGILSAITAAPAGDVFWEIHANLGRLLEAKRSYTAALESYETAAAMVRERTAAAKIQLHIARCLRALGRERESLRALEYAQTLDGENLNIRLERERIEQSLY